MKQVLSKIADLVMWPAYKLDDAGHSDAADAYAMVALVVPFVVAATIALVVLLLV